jgi:ATP-dependent helicase HrpB
MGKPRSWDVPLPIDASLDAIVAAAVSRRALVIEAPPGAGKTTRVPQALLDAIDGEILVLEPRRLAARMAADRVAFELGENVGETCGYKVRYLEKTSKKTRLTFVTEGILTRRLLSDHTLRGVSCVVLDEVHERHLQGDLALALLTALKADARPDLIVIAMSATLDAKPLADFLGAEIVRTEGRRFSVAIDYEAANDERALELRVASAVRTIAKEEADGHILIFLPGAREIRLAIDASESAARAHGLTALPLHGDLTPEEQDRAVKSGGGRKAIFATNVAESSITIDGVVGVVDTGLARVAAHSAWSGLSELVVAKISRASATQRAGRAGRTREGRALRLYTKADFESRPEQETPEIARADLASTALELHSWGRADLRWLEPPPPRAWEAAEMLLAKLGALDAGGRVTDAGKKMLSHALHPRIARMLVEAEARGAVRSGTTLAAILSEGDIRAQSRARFGDRGDRGARGGGGGGGRADDRATEDSDAIAMLDAFEEARDSGFSRHVLNSLGLDARAVHAAERARVAMERGERTLRDDSTSDRDEALSIAILAGFPDRVTRRKRAGARDLIMPGFGAAELADSSVVRHAMFMCAIDATERRGPDGKGAPRPVVRVASAFDPLHVLELFPERVTERAALTFEAEKERVVGRTELVYEELVIDETPVDVRKDPRAKEELFRAAWQKGARTFAPQGELDRWLRRARFAAAQDANVVAPTDDELRALLLEACDGRATFEELRAAGFYDLVVAQTKGRDRIDRLAPDRIRLASGRNARVEYEDDKPPWIESYLQDFCGTTQTPSAGRVPIVLHLLAPNKRAVQVTTDLAGFWDRHYPQIRKELMRRYPRHAWPEDPRSVIVEAKRR